MGQVRPTFVAGVGRYGLICWCRWRLLNERGCGRGHPVSERGIDVRGDGGVCAEING